VPAVRWAKRAMLTRIWSAVSSKRRAGDFVVHVNPCEDYGPEHPMCREEANRATIPQLITFPGPDSMTLHGYIYVPQGQGPFPALLWNHGSEPDPGEEQTLADFYVGHQYVFFIPHRHGQGKSSDAGDYIVDLEQLVQNIGMGPSCAAEFDVKIQGWYTRDVLAALAWLKQQSSVNPSKIYMSGASFGGIQTILTAEEDPGVLGYVPFAPAAESWGNQQLRCRLLDALNAATVPVFLIQARGDYSLGPYELLGRFLLGKGGLNTARLYPKFGTTPEEAHWDFATQSAGIAIWGQDVLT
jgi:carboxymethylenebutenolidase